MKPRSFLTCILVDFLATTIRSNKNYSDYAMGSWAANRDNGIRNYPYSLVRVETFAHDVQVTKHLVFAERDRQPLDIPDA